MTFNTILKTYILGIVNQPPFASFCSCLPDPELLICRNCGPGYKNKPEHKTANAIDPNWFPAQQCVWSDNYISGVQVGMEGVFTQCVLSIDSIFARQSDQHWNCFKGNVGGTPERRGGAHTDFPERIDTILNWTEVFTQYLQEMFTRSKPSKNPPSLIPFATEHRRYRRDPTQEPVLCDSSCPTRLQYWNALPWSVSELLMKMHPHTHREKGRRRISTNRQK